MKRQVIVDGYNLIKRDPLLLSLEQRSLETARQALIARLMSSYNLRTCDITVVFDGSAVAPPAASTDRWGRIKVVYSRPPQTADDVIRGLVAAAKDPSQVVVLSDDRELRDSVQTRGGVVAGSADRRAPRPVDKEREAADRRPQPKKGNPRRAKKKDRRSKKFRW
jgi:predicted RNA-binding protein with PIN domain